ncbi:MAG: bifunctional diaminohydroxyphosphoribosylaminopyrimidine deaminase/5-amino-6-(5-phosphoribosylamino)uracil reductase RibD [Clostridiales bacterium]|nr:bifunctional diaminohydroxyphosphoribosylaminopyrimidine deaminase/5-amino-6-(5-phosphoribosylamino)uracil reductase RibD [Clostridiales bacterium]
MTDEEYMRLALEEAKKGMGFTSPNPMVGAVIVKDGRILNSDYHHKYGEFHAERNALLNCKEDTNGADIYVTLEPCCHHGKTPPCTDIIIEKGIKRVFIGSSDPNPLVAGKGEEILRSHGIEVKSGILKKECDELNEPFFHFITTGTPYVVMKYAMTADGKIATRTGASKWITGEESRNNVQHDRLRCSGIMVGIGTVLADDSLLTCRLEGGRNPIRIICDSSLRTPISSNIVKTAGEAETIIATLNENEREYKKYESHGIKILRTASRLGHIDLNDLMIKLGKMKVDSILMEGGGQLNFSALEAGIVNKVQCYIAPKLFGGENAKTPVSGRGVSLPADAYMLKEPKILFFGDDIMIEWRR